MALNIDEKFLNQHYAVFRDYLENTCGITLGDNKQYLVSSRLDRILGNHDINDLTELVDLIKANNNTALKSEIIDAMTTNETLWFRDSYPYVLLSEHIIPEIRQGRILDKPIRIWSAASSSGQEAYSISMVISEYLRAYPGVLPGGVEIIGTDISKSMVEKAALAEYDNLSLGRGLSQERKQLFFKESEDGKTYQLNEPERSRASFQQLNLLDDFKKLGKFDVIYCRNVLIYFSSDVKQDILRRLSQSLNPNGFLLLGGTESLGAADKYFQILRVGGGVLYQARTE